MVTQGWGPGGGPPPRGAGGLTIEKIEQQQAEIDRLNAAFGGRFRIFKGIESDVLPDGSLDYPDDVLRRFDFIIGSIHGQFRLDRQAQTERLVRATSNPLITVIGHMTGRQLPRRPGYDMDIERVLAACAEHGVAVEVNGNPWRLDLDWRWLRRGIELGCKFSINPDAHSTTEIASSTRWGTSAVAVCCSSASRVSVKSRAFSIAITACREILQQCDLLIGKRANFLTVNVD